MSVSESWAPRLRALFRPDPRLAGPLGLLFVIAMWALTRPYRGLRHDAQLYAAQVLHHVWPERFHSDLFFVANSQDRFSVFSTLMGWLVPHFGLGSTEIAVLIACQLAFVVAVWNLASCYTRTTRWFSTLCAVVLPHTYASQGVFGFAENFLTARSAAEPLALFALVAFARRANALAAGLLVLAAALHPLIALPVAVIVWVMQVSVDRRWLWALLLAVPVMALAFAGVSPFNGLFQRYDPAWWDQVHNINLQVVIAEWPLLDWVAIGMDLAVLALAARHGSEHLRALAKAVICSVVGLVIISMIGVDLLHDVLIASLQLGRILWVSHLLASVCLPLVVLHYWRIESEAGRLVAFAIAAALLAVAANLAQSWVLAAWFLATLYLQRHGRAISTTMRRLAMACTVIAVVTISMISIIALLRAVGSGTEQLRAVQPVLAVITVPLLALSFSIVAAALLRRCSMPVAGLLLLGIFVVGAIHWDQRSEWERRLDDSLFVEHPFERLIPPTATVYWPDQVAATWFMLKRPHFLSTEQTAGVVFNRETAIEAERRRASFDPLLVQQNFCQTIASLGFGTANDAATCSPTVAVLNAICHADPHADFMVFPLRLPLGVVGSWTFTPSPPAKPKTWYLYDCNRL